MALSGNHNATCLNELLLKSALKNSKNNLWYPVRLIHNQKQVEGFIRRQNGRVQFQHKHNDKLYLYKVNREKFDLIQTYPLLNDTDFVFPKEDSQFYAFDCFGEEPFYQDIMV